MSRLWLLKIKGSLGEKGGIVVSDKIQFFSYTLVLRE